MVFIYGHIDKRLISEANDIGNISLYSINLITLTKTLRIIVHR